MKGIQKDEQHKEDKKQQIDEKEKIEPKYYNITNPARILEK